MLRGIGRLSLAGLYKGERSGGRKRLGFRRTAICFFCYLALLFAAVILQTSALSFFGTVPAASFALVCAIGFVGGEKMGAVLGIIGGILVGALGGTGVLLAPIPYLLCGYLCGALSGWFLSENLPSFLIYSLLAGGVYEVYTLISCGLFGKSFDLLRIATKILIPEYFAFLLCVLPAYGAAYGIYALIKRKDNRRKHSF